MIGKLHGIVLDCPDPDRLAGFYAELLGMVRVHDEDDWVVIGDAADRPGLGFHRISDYRPRPGRRRPATGDRPQYRHFDVRVDDLDAAERAVLDLGATRLPGGGDSFRVFADPVGHPFCLILMSPPGAGS